MREINESWAVLHDAASRRRYDDARVRERHAASRAAAGEGPSLMARIMPQPCAPRNAALHKHARPSH
jgi:hypothetical protein